MIFCLILSMIGFTYLFLRFWYIIAKLVFYVLTWLIKVSIQIAVNLIQFSYYAIMFFFEKSFDLIATLSKLPSILISIYQGICTYSSAPSRRELEAADRQTLEQIRAERRAVAEQSSIYNQSYYLPHTNHSTISTLSIVDEN